MKIKTLQEKIEYSFKNISFLEEALTHSSYANEQQGNTPYNERMEFLGDAVLSFVSAQYLYEKYPDMPEGRLSKLRSSLVCTQSLSSFAKEIDLGSCLRMGKGETASGGASRPSVLEDAFEALIAAIYLDGGIEQARKFILHFLSREVENHHSNFKDYKSLLQEIIQQNPDERLSYAVINTSGPDHDKRFEVELRLNSNVIGKGIGTSKKNAEQEAARQALELMGVQI
ncbi:MAG: ribonuclease III [Eubacterium sp.]|nr:ribonuclease III [Eubacterium sp.]